MAYKIVNLHSHFVTNGGLSEHDLVARLHILSGEADLYFKICDPNQKSCKLDKDEIPSKGKIIGSSLNSLTQKTIHKHAIKTIEQKLICGKISSNFSEIQRINKLKEEGYIQRDNCQIALFVIGRNSNKDTMVNFELIVEDVKDVQTLSHGHYLRVSIPPDQVKTYIYQNYPKLQAGKSRGGGNGGKKAADLSLHLDVRYGKVTVCLKHSETRPKFNVHSCDRYFSVDGTQHGSPNSLIVEKLKSLPGKYFILIKGDVNSAINLAIVEQNSSNTERSYLELGDNFVARSLKAGVPISGRLNSGHQYELYSFKLNLEGAVEVININLLAKIGNYKIAVRNDGRVPQIGQGFWVSSDNELLISNENPQFKDKGEYLILVVADQQQNIFQEGKPLSNDSGLADNHEFEIKISYSGKHDTMTPGIPEMGILTHNSKCFVIKILPEYSSLLLVKNLGSDSTTVYASLGSTNYNPNGDHYDYIIPQNQKNLYIEGVRRRCLSNLEKNEDLNLGGGTPKDRNKQHCHLYYCLYSSKRIRYSVVFNYNIQQGKSPFLALNGHRLSLPNFQSRGEYHYLYHARLDSSMYIEIDTDALSLPKIIVKCQRGKDAIDWGFQPRSSGIVAHHSLSSGFSSIYVDKELLKRFKNGHPICLVKLSFPHINRPRKISKISPFMTFKETKILISQGIRELERSRITSQRLRGGLISYFLIYNSEKNENFQIEYKALNNQKLEVYLDKGRNKRPNLRTKIKFEKSIPSILEVNRQILTANGYPKFEGFYVVGIASPSTNKDLEFTIKWDYTSSEVEYLSMNVPFSINQNFGRGIVQAILPYPLQKYGAKMVEIDIDSQAQTEFELYSNILSQKSSFKIVDILDELPSKKSNSLDSIHSDYSFKIKQDQEFNRYSIDLSSNNKKDDFYYFLNSIKHRKEIDAEFLFHPRGSPIKIYLGRKYKGFYQKQVSSSVVYELNVMKNPRRKFLIVESPRRVILVVNGVKIDLGASPQNIWELELPKVHITKLSKSLDTIYRVQIEPFNPKDDSDFEFSIRAYEDLSPMNMRLNRPQKRIVSTEWLQDVGPKVHEYVYTVSKDESKKSLFFELNPENFVFNLFPGYLSRIEFIIIAKSMLILYGDSSNSLLHRPLTMKPRSFSFSPIALNIELSHRPGSYKFLINWGLLYKLIFSNPHADSPNQMRGRNIDFVYQMNLSNKVFFTLTYPIYKIIGLPKNQKHTQLKIFSNTQTPDRLEIKFLKCLGNFEVNLDRDSATTGKNDQVSNFEIFQEGEISKTMIIPTRSRAVSLRLNPFDRIEDAQNKYMPNTIWRAVALEINEFREESDKIYTIQDAKVIKSSTRITHRKIHIEIEEPTVQYPSHGTDSKEGKVKYFHKIIFGGVLTKNPVLADYSSSCPAYHLQIFYPSVYDENEAIRRTELLHDVQFKKKQRRGGNTRYLEVDTEDEEIYYMGIYVIVSIYQLKDKNSYPKLLGTHRQVFKKLEIRTQTFKTEFDILSIFIFFGGIMIVVFTLLFSNVRHLQAMTIGFQSLEVIQENSRSQLEEDIEAYFENASKFFGQDFIFQLEEEVEEVHEEEKAVELSEEGVEDLTETNQEEGVEEEEEKTE